MKLIFTALMVVVSSGSAALAQATSPKICGNGWAAFASCANSPEKYIHICLDPSKTDGSVVVHTLDVKTSKITEEVGIAHVPRDQWIVVETNSSIFKNLTMQRMTANTFGGARDYRPGVQGKSDDLNSFFCKVDDKEAAKIPAK